MSDQPRGPRVQMKMGFKTRQRGRKVLVPQRESDPYQDSRQRISREARLLALAHRWQQMIDEGQAESQAEIAEMMGLSNARVSQIMKLRWFYPALQERIVRPQE